MSVNENIDYGLDEKLGASKCTIYSLQHIVYFLASGIILPIALGNSMGMPPEEVVLFLKNTIFMIGVGSLLQIKFGHRYPIIEGPAGLWASVIIIIVTSNMALGIPVNDVLRQIEMGAIISGVIVAIIGATKLVVQIAKIFTPLVNGVIITLMVLQLSATIIKGGLGITSENSAIDMNAFVIFLVTIVSILVISAFGKGFIRSIATLTGVGIGCVAAAFIGNTEMTYLEVEQQFISAPAVFMPGLPTFNFGVVLTCVISALALLSMTFASVKGMEEIVDKDKPEKEKEKTIIKSITLHGIITSLSGIVFVIPFMPFVSSTGVVLMTRVATRKPFVIGALIMVVFGIVTPFSQLCMMIPTPVAYGALAIVFSLIIGQGLKEFGKIEIKNRESYIIGLSLIIGVGTMFVPPEAIAAVSPSLYFILSNGLILGTFSAILLQFIIRKN